MADLPTGTVTFLFTDIEGSTIRWEQHPEAMRTVLARHDTLLRQVITAHGGYVFKTMGDAVYATFAAAADAVSAALVAQRAVAAEQWGEVGPLRVRMALHSGAAQYRDNDYFGPTLNRVARLLSAGYGGQILLSAATQELARDAFPAGVVVRDLGEHALKDLLRPEHVFQLAAPDLPSEFPPLKSLERHLHNLPVQPTPLIGREQEVASVCGLLSRPEVRLVTLTGPAGVGKTRLGLQVAAELADQFTDGVFAVFLAPVSNPDLVVSALSQALGVTDMGTQPLLTLLKGALKDKHLLLLLDNFEQVVEAALQVADLLSACPRLKVLVTSRVVLHVRAEREFAVPPLSLPNLKRLPDLLTLSQYEAVALFIERALAVKPDFAVTNTNAPAVVGICARLDGLPLAIELAAARVKYFPPQILLTRLEQGLAVLVGGARDLPARQQTLRGAFAWSYDLLSPEEQALFRRLAVFVDGCTWEAAEQVCTAAGQLDGDILEGLASLVDKSLLRQEEQAEGVARFWMLQVLREFGLEALAGAGESEATRTAHTLYYLALAEEAEPYLKGTEQVEWLNRLEQEHENLRAALTFLLERAGMQQGSEQAEQALRLCAALWRFWYIHGDFTEGRTFLERALATSERVAALVQAKALQAAAALALALDDLERAEALLGESLALCRERGDKPGTATSLGHLGFVTWLRNHYAAARSMLEEAEALLKELGDTWGRARCLTNLACVISTQGEYSRARVLLEESLGLYRSLGDRERLGRVLCLLARVCFESQSDPAKAEALAEQSLALAREVGYKWGIAYPISLLAEIVLGQGDATGARALAEESVATLKELGDRGGSAEALLSLAHIAVCQGDVAVARRLYQESLALLRALGYKYHIATCLEGLAVVVAGQGALMEAARLWGAAEALREAIGAPLAPVYRSEYERAVVTARAQLDEEAFASAWAGGRTMPLEQVINEALKMAS
jgi:predicted ATPase/class 3 adenylate cyclase